MERMVSVIARLSGGQYLVGLTCGHTEVKLLVGLTDGGHITWRDCNKCLNREPTHTSRYLIGGAMMEIRGLPLPREGA